MVPLLLDNMNYSKLVLLCKVWSVAVITIIVCLMKWESDREYRFYKEQEKALDAKIVELTPPAYSVLNLTDTEKHMRMTLGAANEKRFQEAVELLKMMGKHKIRRSRCTTRLGAGLSADCWYDRVDYFAERSDEAIDKVGELGRSTLYKIREEVDVYSEPFQPLVLYHWILASLTLSFVLSTGVMCCGSLKHK